VLGALEFEDLRFDADRHNRFHSASIAHQTERLNGGNPNITRIIF